MIEATSLSLGGLSRIANRINDIAKNVADPKNFEQIDSNLVELKKQEIAYGANAKVLSSQLGRDKYLLDILA